MGQTERALNRLYGVESDRPTFQKYRLALLLAVSAGILGAIAFASLALRPQRRPRHRQQQPRHRVERCCAGRSAWS